MVIFGGTWLAGCGTDDESSGGNANEPFDVEPQELLPPASVLEDAVDISWVARDKIETGIAKRAQANAAYRAAHDEEEAHFDAVEMGAWVFADAEAAQAGFDDLPYHNGWGMTSGDIGVESLEGVLDRESEYRIVFRDVNAMGALAYLNPRSGNGDQMQSYGRDLATAMHTFWQD